MAFRELANSLSPGTHLRLLQNSDRIVVAIQRPVHLQLRETVWLISAMDKQQTKTSRKPLPIDKLRAGLRDELQLPNPPIPISQTPTYPLRASNPPILHS